jgi:pyrimidine deaminase RibD-like protein
MRLALSLATQSPPRPTNFRVGAVLVDPPTNRILATGYTLELEGNTHAEQCCLSKLATARGVSEDALGSTTPTGLDLYTTMEPCSVRLSGNVPCAQRVVQAAPLVGTVYVGVMEPDRFVSENTGRGKLEGAGVRFVHVGGMEEEILAVATAGHREEAGGA